MEKNITNYDLSNQKMINQIDRMDHDICSLTLRASVPCISITGLKHLQIGKVKMSSKITYTAIIEFLFKTLNIPQAWILSIEPTSFISNETHIFLISEQIKCHVYKTFVRYFSSIPKEKKLFVKIKY